MTQLRYVVYARKSSESRERQVASIDDQISECQKFALNRQIVISHAFKESKSAFKINNREQFNLMLEMIREGSINAILTWKLDRICRNPVEGAQVLQLLDEGKLLELRTVMGDIYTKDSDTLILYMQFGMANQYSKNLSQNVKRGIKYKIERGEYPRPALPGYMTYGETGQKNIKPDPLKAPLIREAFELASSGLFSLRSLCDALYEKGLRSRKNKKVEKSHLYQMLTNPTYYGYFKFNDELHKGNYEPLITKQLFDQVQIALENRTKPKLLTWKDQQYIKGMVHCGECGCAITTTVKRKYYKTSDRTAEYTYHHCTKRRGKCSQVGLVPSEMEAEILRNIDSISLDEEVWSLGIKLLKERHRDMVKQHGQAMLANQHQYNTLQDKLNRLIEMRADGELTKNEFMSQKQLLLAEQERVNSLIKDTQGSSRNWLELAENFLETAYKAKEIIREGTPQQKRNLILSIGENLTLKEKKIDFRFKKPYDVLLKPEYRSDVLPDKDSNLENLLQREA